MKRLKEALQRHIYGQDDVIDEMIVGLLAKGHILLEGVPGVGKTRLAQTLANAFSIEMQRISFTPDLLPSDVLGSVMYDMKNAEFKTEKGPIFTNILLADEINRTPPKTQAALLEAMEERQVTLYGQSYPLPATFFVIATQNPFEHAGTYPLPEAQLDRFLFRLPITYPAADMEFAMLKASQTTAFMNHTSGQQVSILREEDLILWQQEAQEVVTSDAVLQYILDLIRATRSHPAILLGASPRAAIALLTASKANARLLERDFVIPDDVLRVLTPVLNHRLRLTPSAELEGLTSDEVIQQLVNSVVVSR